MCEWNEMEQLGYSPYYCSRQFNQLTGMTLRDYIWTRRISRAALELRDTDQRVLDVAVMYGFSSQEAFTRAFNKAFQLTLCILPKSSPSYSVGFSSGGILALSLFDQGVR